MPAVSSRAFWLIPEFRVAAQEAEMAEKVEELDEMLQLARSEWQAHRQRVR